nr:MAG TPA: hypothetical protein [Caudoviricetes sp.]
MSSGRSTTTLLYFLFTLLYFTLGIIVDIKASFRYIMYAIT